MDPGVVWGTHLGGGLTDRIHDMQWQPGSGVWVGGWTGSMDFPVTDRNRARLDRLTQRLNRVVVDAGGRFYFAKDAVVTADAWRASLGDEVVGRFFALKRLHDPDLLIQGNLWRRVMAPLWREVPQIDAKLPPITPAVEPEAVTMPTDADGDPADEGVG